MKINKNEIKLEFMIDGTIVQFGREDIKKYFLEGDQEKYIRMIDDLERTAETTIDWSVPGGVIKIPKGVNPIEITKKDFEDAIKKMDFCEEAGPWTFQPAPWFIAEQDRKTTEERLQLLMKVITEATGLQGLCYYEGPDMECWMAHDIIKRGSFCLAGILADDCKDLKQLRQNLQIREEGNVRRASLLSGSTAGGDTTRIVKKGPRMPQDERKGTKPTNTQGKEK